ncbi:MAG TPA: bifunctional 5,10-methylenetetrahydrofolate dehydrogenase/5,10-methenyltetrahydrofolate cyclohydrolase [Thermomicrobiales bacterium]
MAEGTTTILKGAALAARMREEITAAIDQLIARGGRPPRLVTVLAGEHPSALAYRSSIARTMARVGIEHVPLDLPEDITERAMVRELHVLSSDPEVTGVLVLMPLPPQVPMTVVYEHLSPLKDVDGITPTNAGRLHLGLPSLRPSTPQGGIELLDHYGIPIEGKRAVVVGRSNVVGRPFAALLLQRHATVTICHRRTVDLASVVREADLVGIAAGHAGLITRDMVKPGAVVVDFGVNVIGDRIVGDADYEALLGRAGAITPVPGGTGPVTALVLARNTVAAGFAALAGSLDHVETALRDLPCL